MSGTINPSEREEIIEIISLDEPEEILIAPKSKQTIPVYYEDPGNYTVFGLDRGYVSEKSNPTDPSTND